MLELMKEVENLRKGGQDREEKELESRKEVSRARERAEQLEENLSEK